MVRRVLKDDGNKREGQLGLYVADPGTSCTEMEVSFMLFERFNTKIERDLSNSIKETLISGVKFSWTTLQCLCAKWLCYVEKLKT